MWWAHHPIPVLGVGQRGRVLVVIVGIYDMLPLLLPPPPLLLLLLILLLMLLLLLLLAHDPHPLTCTSIPEVGRELHMVPLHGIQQG